MSAVTIYHNPRCSKSRETLELLRQASVEPEIVLYLDTPPSTAILSKIVADLGIDARALLRSNEKPYEELGLADPKWTNEALIGFMHAHPILMNRPIVVTAKGTRLGRPPESVLEIL